MVCIRHRREYSLFQTDEELQWRSEMADNSIPNSNDEIASVDATAIAPNDDALALGNDSSTGNGAPAAATGAVVKSRLRSSNLTHEQKRLICIHAKQNPTITQAQLGQWAKERFGLPTIPSQSSISHTLKRKHNFEHMKSEELASKRMRSVKFPELDIALANWFLHCQARQVKIQGDEIKAKAHLFFEIMAIPTQDPPQFSNGWLHSFQSRHGFSRSPNQTQGSVELPVITTRNEFAAAVEGVAPWDIYWMDETRLLFTMSPELSDAAFGYADQQQHGKRMTVAFCTNADASDMLDPFFICSEPLQNSASASVGFQYAYNKNTWMTPTVFREWLLALDWKMHEENRHILLLLDSYSSHQVKKMALKNVSVRFVAPPLPLAGESLFTCIEKEIFTAVKRRYRHVFLDHVLDRRDERQVDIYDVDPLQAIQWVVRCWRQVPKAIIGQGFANLGVPTSSEFVVDAQAEEKLDAQILALLKRLKLKSPMKLSDFLYPAAEHVVDEELSDQDFVDTAMNAMLGTTVAGSETEPPRRAPRGRAKKPATPATRTGNAPASERPQVVVPVRASKTSLEGGASQPHDHAVANPPAAAASAAGSTAVEEDEWQAWATSHRMKTSSDDFQALQRVIRLATEMNCETSTILDLNRMLLEVTQAQALALPLQEPAKEESLQSTGVCRFTFGTPNKHVV